MSSLSVVLLMLVGTLALEAGSLSATASTPTASSPAVAAPAVVAKPAAAKTPWTPPAGVTINNPLGTVAQRTANLHKIRLAIQHSRKGSQITVASWNIRSPNAEHDLILAQRRGVRVRVLMDRGNGNAKNVNPGFNNMQRQLRVGNAKRPSSMRSWAKECVSSCRGKSGISHTKMYLFSQVGQATDVVMYGSANLTDLAATGQWNDLYTIRNRPDFYNFALGIFVEMTKDHAVANAWQYLVEGGINLGFLPWVGAGTSGDPVMNMLNQVHCTGADQGAGNGGRTAIRIAQTAMTDSRGIALAKKLHQLWNQGCDIRVIYAVMGKQVLQVFRTGGPRGPIPFRQVVQDFNGDFVYDRYLHTKVLALSGVYGSNHHAEIAWNGSSNWTTVSLHSDDIFARIDSAALRMTYAKFVNRWFLHPPSSKTTVDGGNVGGAEARRAVGSAAPVQAPAGVDRYAKIQVN